MPAIDSSGDNTGHLSARHAAVITPSGADLTEVTRAVFVGTGGDLEVIMQGGQTVVIPDVPSGAFLPIRVSRIINTNTTATGIVAFW